VSEIATLRALRLAPIDRRRRDRLEEMLRLVGRPVEIGVELRVRVPDELALVVRSVKAMAVLADSYSGDLQALRVAVAPVPVLRPLLERRPGVHAGGPEERFVGYGLLHDDGTVEALPDGALAP
jgi:hypothetical protein